MFSNQITAKQILPENVCEKIVCERAPLAHPQQQAELVPHRCKLYHNFCSINRTCHPVGHYWGYAPAALSEVKSLRLIWRLDTCECHLRVLIFKVALTWQRLDLTNMREHQDSHLRNGHQVAWLHQTWTNKYHEFIITMICFQLFTYFKQLQKIICFVLLPGLCATAPGLGLNMLLVQSLQWHLGPLSLKIYGLLTKL